MQIVVILEPHIGTLYQWNPILHELKRLGQSEITLVVPCECYLRFVPPEDSGLVFGSQVARKVIMANRFGIWRAHDTLVSAHANSRENYARRNFLSRASHYLSHRVSLARLTSKIKALSNFDGIDLNATDIVLFDLFGKPIDHLAFAKRFARARWFSLPHGINPRIHRNGDPEIKNMNALDQLLVKAFVHSEIDKSTYPKLLGLEDSRFSLVGVPRHDDSWIEKEQSNQIVETNCGNRFIFVTSRASSSFFPISRKRLALTSIGRLAESLGVRLVIRRHPREEETEVFEQTLGAGNYGTNWEFTNLSPTAAATNAIFAVSFLSSTIVDLVAMRVPVIQFFDTAGLSRDPQFLKTASGDLITKYEYLGLVLPCSNPAELSENSRKILRERHSVIEEQHRAYRRIYPSPRGAVRKITMNLLVS